MSRDVSKSAKKIEYKFISTPFKYRVSVCDAPIYAQSSSNAPDFIHIPSFHHTNNNVK